MQLAIGVYKKRVGLPAPNWAVEQVAIVKIIKKLSLGISAPEQNSGTKNTNKTPHASVVILERG